LFASLSTGAGVGASAGLDAAPGGYLDNAIPKTMLRLRYDAAFDVTRPDRGEYFWAAWKELSFHPHGINNEGVLFDPRARGLTALPQSVDYQEASIYLEYAHSPRFSFFTTVPFRFVDLHNLQEDFPESERKRNPADLPNPGSPFYPEPRSPENTMTPHTDEGGISDIDFGIKYAFLADPDRYLTLQFRTFIPTGSAQRGIGNGHVSLEPDLLWYRRLPDRWVFQGQLGIWVPVDGTSLASQVVEYGVGVGYELYRGPNVRVLPITEFVGWTFLDGYAAYFGKVTATPSVPNLELPVTHGVEDAGGDTIINAKVGVRTYFGRRSDVYVGYGRALTGNWIYRDIFRLEYRIAF
jgi:hypothetical protein